METLIQQTSPVAFPPSKLVVKDAESPPCQNNDLVKQVLLTEGDIPPTDDIGMSTDTPSLNPLNKIALIFRGDNIREEGHKNRKYTDILHNWNNLKKNFSR
uniref:Uncharacterized protein n=1 Tax=viral metagenome TaxID=1070528 RepID=A0A6C0ICD1_9ZZZZ